MVVSDAMASGHGINGRVGRCYPFFAEFKECMVSDFMRAAAAVAMCWFLDMRRPTTVVGGTVDVGCRSYTRFRVTSLRWRDNLVYRLILLLGGQVWAWCLGCY